jgi:hypothetical protein
MALRRLIRLKGAWREALSLYEFSVRSVDDRALFQLDRHPFRLRLEFAAHALDPLGTHQIMQLPQRIGIAQVMMRLQIPGDASPLGLAPLGQTSGQGQQLAQCPRPGRRRGRRPQAGPAGPAGLQRPGPLPTAATLAGRQNHQAPVFQPIEHVARGDVVELARGRAPVPKPRPLLGQSPSTPVRMRRAPPLDLLQVGRCNLASPEAISKPGRNEVAAGVRRRIPLVSHPSASSRRRLRRGFETGSPYPQFLGHALTLAKNSFGHRQFLYRALNTYVSPPWFGLVGGGSGVTGRSLPASCRLRQRSSCP